MLIVTPRANSVHLPMGTHASHMPPHMPCRLVRHTGIVTYGQKADRQYQTTSSCALSMTDKLNPENEIKALRKDGISSSTGRSMGQITILESTHYPSLYPASGRHNKECICQPGMQICVDHLPLLQDSSVTDCMQ